MENQVFQECAERVIRIVLNQVINSVELKVQYSDLIKMVTAQIEHDLGSLIPKQTTFHREVTNFVLFLENQLPENQSATHTLQELKDLITKLNKDYLTSNIEYHK